MASDSATTDRFIMDGLSASTLTDEYVETSLPAAGVNAIQKTVAGTGDDFRTAMNQIRDLQSRIDRWDGVSQARSVEELRTGDDLQIVFGFQDSTPLGRDADNVQLFSQLGIKIIQLTYNSRNFCANGCTERVDDGLSDYAFDVIDALESNNVILDLSHVGPKSAMEALEYASEPTVFSHSNPAGIHEHARNISDEHILAAVETGGMVGVNAYPAFVGPDPTVESVVEHVEYLDDLIGAENITLGLDFVDNCPEEELEFLGENPHYPDPPYTYPEGLGSETEIGNLAATLLEHGFSEQEVDGIMGENLLELYSRVWEE